MALGMYLQLDGIEGSSTATTPAGAIVIANWGFTVVGPEERTAGASNEFDVTIYADASIPRLFVACLRQDVLPSGRITVRGGGGIEMLMVRMEAVVVTHIGATADHAEMQPLATIGLACRRVGGIYTPTTSTGISGEAIGGGWDLVADREWDPLEGFDPSAPADDR